MSSVPGIIVGSPITTGDTTNTFATHYAMYGRGGYRTVTNVSDLYNIPNNPDTSNGGGVDPNHNSSRLEVGMLVYVSSTTTIYMLTSVPTPPALTTSANWKIFSGPLVGSFLGLTDTPKSYTGVSGYLLYVNPNQGGTGIPGVGFESASTLIPNLQQVTTVGNTTTNNIIFPNAATASSGLPLIPSNAGSLYQSSYWNGTAAVTGMWGIQAGTTSSLANGTPDLDFSYASSAVVRFSSTGGLFCGILPYSTYISAKYPHSYSIISQAQTGNIFTAISGLTVEAVASSSLTAVGVAGIGATNGIYSGIGFYGVGYASPSDTATAYGLFGTCTSSHSGANYGVYSTAVGGTSNYSFWGNAGNVYNHDMVRVGIASNLTNYPSAKGYFSASATSPTLAPYNIPIGLVGEAISGTSTGQTGVGLYGLASAVPTLGCDCYGMFGVGSWTTPPSSSLNLTVGMALSATVSSVGFYGRSLQAHPLGGANIAFLGNAGGGGASTRSGRDFLLYGLSGDVYTNGRTAFQPGAVIPCTSSLDYSSLTTTFVKVVGSGGPQTISSVPLGSDDGQIVIIEGTDSTNTVTITNITPSGVPGVILAGGSPAVLGSGDNITLMFNYIPSPGTSYWMELSRSVSSGGIGTYNGSISLATGASFSLPKGIGQLSVWVNKDLPTGYAPPSLVGLVYNDSNTGTYNAVDVQHYGAVTWGSVVANNLCVYWVTDHLVITNNLTGGPYTIEYSFNCTALS